MSVIWEQLWFLDEKDVAKTEAVFDGFDYEIMTTSTCRLGVGVIGRQGVSIKRGNVDVWDRCLQPGSRRVRVHMLTLTHLGPKAPALGFVSRGSPGVGLGGGGLGR
jgi:hypothetical protein